MLAIRTLCLVLLPLAGCITVRSSTSPSANLAHYRTFAWYASPTPTVQQTAFERSPAGELVRDRIARDLRARGIRESPDRPDFFVAYIKSGQGTLGGVIYDPAIYEDLRTIVGGVRRNVILRTLGRYVLKHH